MFTLTVDAFVWSVDLSSTVCLYNITETKQMCSEMSGSGRRMRSLQIAVFFCCSEDGRKQEMQPRAAKAGRKDEIRA